MNVLVDSTIFNSDQIKVIEDRFTAQYVCETTIRFKNGWADFPVAIFYTEKAHAEGSNWMAVNWSYDKMICVRNGISAVLEPFTGIVADNGDVIYSRYRHDFRTSPDGSVTIDGGREYTRLIGEKSVAAKRVSLQIKKNKLEIVS